MGPRALWIAKLSALLVVGVSLAVSPEAASARARSMTIQELVDRSEFVVIGRVIDVIEVAGKRVARVEVARQILGPYQLHEFMLLAEPTWQCDVSDAKEDEVALLFVREHDFGWEYPVDAEGNPLSIAVGWKLPEELESELAALDTGLPVFDIVWSGRGRWPIYRGWLREYVELPLQLRLVPKPVTRDGKRGALLIDILDLLSDAADRRMATRPGAQPSQ